MHRICSEPSVSITAVHAHARSVDEVGVACHPPLEFVVASNLDADTGLAPVPPLCVVAVGC